MLIKIIDTHCHLDMEEFDKDRNSIVERSKAGGIKAVIMPSTKEEDFAKEENLCKEYENFLFYLVGVHPHEAKTCRASTYDAVVKHFNNAACRGVGEIGLDYHYEYSDRAVQKEVFSNFLDLAVENDSPVSIHSRESTDDMVDILKTKHGLRGVIHCFSGEEKLLKIGLDLGLYFGIGGVLTFKKSILKETIKKIPVESIVFETDAPYLAPVPKRGKRNEPLYIKYVAKELALLINCSEDVLFDKIYKNSINVFGLELNSV